jgi:hypothetical protein
MATIKLRAILEAYDDGNFKSALKMVNQQMEKGKGDVLMLKVWDLIDQRKRRLSFPPLLFPLWQNDFLFLPLHSL